MFRTHWFHSVAAHFLDIGHCHFANRPLPFCKFYIFRFYFLASTAVLQIYMFFGFTFCESATAVLQIYMFFGWNGFTFCKSATAVLQICIFRFYSLQIADCRFANRPFFWFYFCKSATAVFGNCRFTCCRSSTHWRYYEEASQPSCLGKLVLQTGPPKWWKQLSC